MSARPSPDTPRTGSLELVGGREESPQGFRRPYIRTKENSASA